MWLGLTLLLSWWRFAVSRRGCQTCFQCRSAEGFLIAVVFISSSRVLQMTNRTATAFVMCRHMSQVLEKLELVSVISVKCWYPVMSGSELCAVHIKHILRRIVLLSLKCRNVFRVCLYICLYCNADDPRCTSLHRQIDICTFIAVECGLTSGHYLHRGVATGWSGMQSLPHFVRGHFCDWCRYDKFIWAVGAGQPWSLLLVYIYFKMTYVNLMENCVQFSLNTVPQFGNLSTPIHPYDSAC